MNKLWLQNSAAWKIAYFAVSQLFSYIFLSVGPNEMKDKAK